MNKEQAREIIARRVSREFKSGDLVNLGIGLPTYVANFIPEDIDVIFHSENGFIGMGPQPPKGGEIVNLVNAGSQPVTIQSGGSFFDSCMSFTIIRGGHLDCTVLGALQVDEKGNLANWMIPGKKSPGMGGAMDLVTGSKKVIVAMEHTSNGDIKIMKRCSLPLTAVGQVNLIITELGVIEVTPLGLILREKHPDFTLEEIQSLTGADLIIHDEICNMI